MKVSRLAQELRAAGREIVDMSAGEPDFPSPAAAVDAARQALAEGFTRYTAAAGTPDLRDAVAARYSERYGAPWSRSGTLITIGAKAALFELFQVLLEDGDEVVYPSPAWVSFVEQIRFAGARPVPVETSAEDGFTLHAEALWEAVTDATRAILVNSPANPTGGMIGEDDLAALVERAAERGIVVVSDETYDRFVYDGRTHASVAALAREYPETVALVGSFSKTYAMTGWRIGYALGSEKLIGRASSLQSHMTSNPTSFAMRGALAALECAEPDVERMIAAFEARRDALVARLEQVPGIRCRKPAGAFYAFPDVSEHFRGRRRGSVALAEYLLESAGVALVPGLAFGNDNHIRISFACSLETLDAGMTRIEQALSP